MRPLVIFLAFLFIHLQLYAQKNTFSAEDLQLKGKVRSCSVYFYGHNFLDTTTTDDRRLPEQWYIKIATVYDKAGKLVNERWYEKRDSSKIKIVFNNRHVYDKQGYKISTYDMSGKLTEDHRFYNGHQKEVSYTGRFAKIIIKRNKIGDITEQITYERGLVTERVIYRYLKDNKVAITHIYVNKQEALSDHNTADHKGIITYNKRHNKIDDIQFAPDGSRKSHEWFIYDDDGNNLKSIDSNVNYTGGLPRKRETENTISLNFKYQNIDKQGNWLEKSFLYSDKFIVINRREIHYY